MSNADPFYKSLGAVGEVVGKPLPVTLSPELVGLLSEQLYRSPSKAIEELVVNGFDAEADEARVFVPEPETNVSFIVVFDDGLGMTYEGLADLWKVGRPKTRDDSVFERKQRKQIGKFGIGKLSTYAVAKRVTYVTKSHGQHYAVTIDYGAFTSSPSATPTEVKLPVRKIDDLGRLWKQDSFRKPVEALRLNYAKLTELSSWTLVILEELKGKALTMGLGRLRRVLRTAMPLSARFRLFLNGDQVESSKEDYEIRVQFCINNLPDVRLRALKKKTGQEWSFKGENLYCQSFPSGISGNVIVTRKTLQGKSAELVRSEGFFVFVRDRLVNEEDARFGLHELSHATLNRFRANIYADDLDQIVTANRESMEDVKLYRDFQAVLNEVFNEARQQYEDIIQQEESSAGNAREDSRDWVPIRLVEYPTADALTRYSEDLQGSEPDESWMYLDVDSNADIDELTTSLYQVTSREGRYRYQYAARGRADRLVTFDPVNSVFTINQDHELVVAYSGDSVARALLQDLVTSEALLEVYLRDADIKPHLVGEILERRDMLLRGLANSHMFSLEALSEYIRDSASSKTDLEIGVVAGTRSLGFVAKHLGGPGEPDGVARFTDFPLGEQKITLEAKSSVDKPSAKDIDFAAIRTHIERHDASGCLLVAPGYPGDAEGNVALSSNRLKISCWTVVQFADVVAAAESRHISARQVLEVVRNKFAPHDVSKAVDKLLADPTWEPRALYLAVVKALRNSHNILTDSPRNIPMIATQITHDSQFVHAKESDIRKAVTDIACASQGALVVRGNNVVLNVDYDELERRVRILVGASASPRRKDTFAES